MAKVERDHILELYTFHHWATDRVFDALVPVTAEQLDTTWGGSFGTGRALLQHVVGVEALWLARWNGDSPDALPDFPLTHGGDDFAEEWRTVKTEQQNFLGDLSNAQLDSDLTYVNLKGEKWTYPLSDVLVHVVNHGTYHRGQLTHLLRDLRVQPPSTDYLVFADARRAGRV